jgi:hypothetical protein
MTEDSDPTHIDPAGDLADLFETGEIDADLDDDQDAEDLREFVDEIEQQVEAGETDADPGLNAMVRIARTMLDDVDD